METAVMEDVKVQIVNYDEEYHTLTVFFSKTIDDFTYETQHLCYDVSQYHDIDIDSMIQNIAKSAPDLINEQIRKRMLNNNIEKINDFKSLIGTQLNVNVEITDNSIDQRTGEDLEVIV